MFSKVIQKMKKAVMMDSRVTAVCQKEFFLRMVKRLYLEMMNQKKKIIIGTRLSPERNEFINNG